MKALSFCLFTGMVFISCTHHAVPVNSSVEPASVSAGISSPPCIIYRMRADYSANVPVMLSDDKSQIVSYPDIRDIYYKGKLSLPTPLAGGYYLDNRGIGINVAFLSYTYEEYSRLPSTPSGRDLMGMLLDKDPLTGMYQCGQRGQYTDIEQELNELISTGRLNTCRKVK